MSAWVPEHDKRQPKASAKVGPSLTSYFFREDSKPGLKSHQAARDLAITGSEATKTLTFTTKKSSTGTRPAPITTTSQSTSAKRKQSVSVHAVEDQDLHAVLQAPALKKSRVVQSDDEIEQVRPITRVATTSEAAPSTEGLSPYEDSEPEEPTVLLKEKTKDVDAFFHPSEKVGGKPRRACILCKAKGSMKTIVAESTTLRRHIEAIHLPKYNAWCNRNDFESKLPKAVKARKDARAAEDRSKQSSLDPHLEERRRETSVSYSDTVFREAAIEWLIQTDQPIQALEHPSFRKMINIASRATKGVNIPNRKATRKHIIEVDV